MDEKFNRFLDPESFLETLPFMSYMCGIGLIFQGVFRISRQRPEPRYQQFKDSLKMILAGKILVDLWLIAMTLLSYLCIFLVDNVAKMYDKNVVTSCVETLHVFLTIIISGWPFIVLSQWREVNPMRTFWSNNDPYDEADYYWRCNHELGSSSYFLFRPEFENRMSHIAMKRSISLEKLTNRDDSNVIKRRAVTF